MSGNTAKFSARTLLTKWRAFSAAESGNVAVIFALACIPVLTGIGAAVDYSRASATKESVQAALDSALIAGAKDGSAGWVTTATNVFKANLAAKSISASDPSFTKDGSSYYAGSVTASVPTSILNIVGIHTMGVNASGKAAAGEGDNSCILSLDHGQAKSHVSLRMNGAPKVSLTNCSIRSNTSLDCNGHDGNVAKSYAAGSVTGCGHPTSNAAIVPDTFVDLAKNIGSTLCAGAKPGVTWNPGIVPTGGAVKTLSKTGYTEYHICGDLTLAGSGFLTGSAPAADTVIIIENGSLIIDDKASITAMRTVFVMTGDNNSSAQIVFPKGNGKAATLSLSPPTAVGNPWKSVSLYLDPKLTKDVDNTWGPGATFNADGLVYLGTSNVETHGNAGSSNSKCTKFVVNSFLTNGSIALDFSQQNCTTFGLKQWDGVAVYLVN